MKKAILGILITFLVIPVSAQDITDIIVFIDEETLVIYVPGNGTASLDGLGFEVEINSKKETYYLEDYSAFRVMDFAALPIPICFKLELNGSRNPLPQECPSNKTSILKMSPADVFWFDSVSNQAFTLSIIQGNQPIGFCPAGNPRCEINFSITQDIPEPPSMPTNPTEWEIVVEEKDGVEMVLVPAGCFIMGSDRTDEKPQQEICFGQDYWIDRYEVSQGVFEKLDGEAQHPNAWAETDAPRGNVTWFEAQAFCELRGGRLPSEGEWEYAARGPNNFIYPWGDIFIPENSIYKDNMPNGRAENVNTLPEGASWVGAYHMTGNMLEWVSSIYALYPYDANDGREDLNNQDENRVIRGGSWLLDPVDMRLVNRNLQSPNYYLDYLGFRCLLTTD